MLYYGPMDADLARRVQNEFNIRPSVCQALRPSLLESSWALEARPSFGLARAGPPIGAGRGGGGQENRSRPRPRPVDV